MKAMTIKDRQARAAEVNQRLKQQYPDARVELDFNNPFELLIATILAAQTERGDEMLTVMAQRHGRHALDLDARGALG